jgi:membrane fusion protein, multidrug efflux system
MASETEAMRPGSVLREPRRRAAVRRRALTALCAAIALAAAAWGGYWYVELSRVETTDDAYVGGDVVQVTSEIAGTVIALHVDDTETVRRGQPLLELDPADAEVGMAAAKAGLAQAVRQVRALFAKAEEMRAQIAEHEAALRRANDDLRRRSLLARSGAVSEADLAHARDAEAQERAALDAATRQRDETLAQIAGTRVADNPIVASAAARLREAALALRRTRLVAPVDGVVARRSVQLGQRLAAGAPLMAIVPLDDLWVDANFKEVQLERLRTGQRATLKADVYGRQIVYHGTVAGLAAGTGSAFSLLPTQNATGNWIKIVQRVPVRILIDEADLKAHPLRLGLSMAVTVEAEDAPAAERIATRNRPLPARPSDADDPATDALIARIIAENAGE